MSWKGYWMSRRARVAAWALAGGLATGSLVGVAAAQVATAQKRFGDWAAYKEGDGAKAVCFAVTKAKDSKPAGLRRDAYFYVSAWPAEGVRTEPSVHVGVALKGDTRPTLTIGTQSFQMFAADGKAYIESPADELKLIDAMKKGASLVVVATSETGAQTGDTFSLSGISAALQYLAQSCQ